ncbi:MAG: MFS transporter [Clostridia bacterium]|nr:MFS transporter [Clostridia bacterium]
MNEYKAGDSMTNVFRNRNFRLVFFGALVSNVGALLYSFAVSFYILEITDNNAFLQGLYLALCGAVNLIFMPIGGVMGDRFHKGKIMFVCDYLKGGVILSATLAMITLRTPTAHLVILFIAGILGNAIGGVFAPASSALLPHIVEDAQLQQANSYFSVMHSLQSIIGVVLAGVLYAAMPIHLLFLIVGVCYVASGVSEMFIRYAHERPEGKLTVKSALADFGEGLRYIKAQKALLVLMIAILFINFFFVPVTSNFIPFFIKTDLAGAEHYLFDSFLTPELWSSVLSVLIGASSMIGALVLSARPQAEKVGRRVSLLLGVEAVILLGMTGGYWILVHRGVSLNAFLILMCAGCLLTGVTIVNINIPTTTTLMRIVDKSMLGKVNSVISISSQGLIPIASVLAGAILQGVGSTALLLFCTAGFIVTAVMLLANPRTKEI